jgi:L-seryl-tRNA(Ser) seleniumtransferase
LINQELLKKISSVNLVLEKFEVYYPDFYQEYRSLIKKEIVYFLDSLRSDILSNKISDVPNLDKMVIDIKNSINNLFNLNHHSVINATGIVINTNLGRAILSENISNKLSQISQSYSNLEYDLESSNRGSRHNHISSLLTYITGSESGFAVNNNAAALLLVCSEFAKCKEIIVSRGELIEIGDSFRLPDIIELSGAKLVEVGSTNRTYISDYEKAINSNTGLILKSHWSNYRIQGFTKSVTSKEISDLGKKYSIPTFEDLGSGLIFQDNNNPFFKDEPKVIDSVKSGVDLICFSGDKVLGSSQAGIILGKKVYIDKLKKNPLARAVRIDKLNLSVLEMTLKEYLKDKKSIIENIPVIKMLSMTYEELETITKSLYQNLISQDLDTEINIIDSISFAGGGSLPEEKLLTPVLQIKPINISLNTFAKILRVDSPHIIGRIEKKGFIINLRTVNEKQISFIENRIVEVLKKSGK